MSDLKTKKNSWSVKEFINKIEDNGKRKDAFQILDIMQKITWDKPKMWWASIVGFWEYRYVYASGREWDWMITGFSPRKTSLTLYIMPGFNEYDWSNKQKELLEKLWKHKTWKSCLYIKKLEDIDLQVLEQIIKVKKYH